MKLSDEVRGSGISTVQTQWADGISALEERLAIEKKRVLEQAVEILDLREELRRGAA